jgi:hypothetical protein
MSRYYRVPRHADANGMVIIWCWRRRGRGFHHDRRDALGAGADYRLRMEVAQFGIDVVLIEPGPVKTPWNDVAAASLSAADPEGPHPDGPDPGRQGGLHGGTPQGTGGPRGDPGPDQQESRRQWKRSALTVAFVWRM